MVSEILYLAFRETEAKKGLVLCSLSFHGLLAAPVPGYVG